MSNHDREPRRPLPNERELRHEVLGHGREPARVLQWLGFFLAPVVFFAHLQVAYVLIPWGCTMRNELWQHVVGLVAVVLSAAGLAAAWVTRARAPEAAAHPTAHPVIIWVELTTFMLLIVMPGALIVAAEPKPVPTRVTSTVLPRGAAGGLTDVSVGFASWPP